MILFGFGMLFFAVALGCLVYLVNYLFAEVRLLNRRMSGTQSNFADDFKLIESRLNDLTDKIDGCEAQLFGGGL